MLTTGRLPRLILISVAISSMFSSFATALVLSFVLPASVGAQALETRIRAQQVVAVGPEGVDRARLFVGPGVNSSVSALSADGRVRTVIATGGPTGSEPETADVVVFAQDGTRLARLGTRRTPDSNAAGVDLLLSDAQGHVRLDLLVAEDGTPAIHMLDADGNVTWSAP